MTIREIMQYKVGLISTQSRPVYFLFASWIEVCDNLVTKNKSKTYEYPLIVLHREFDEINLDKKINTIPELKMYIIALSDLNYSSVQREVNVFSPIIQSVYDDFVTSLKKGAYIKKTGTYNLEITTKKFYNFFIGDKQNKLPDELDAIELTFKNLQYYLKNC